MKLHVAIDLTTYDAAMALCGKVAPFVDIIEAGTPLIKNEGLRIVKAIKNAFPEKAVFADMKTMDAGALEAELAFDSGADFVTVLALANDHTLESAVNVANKYGRQIIVDMIDVDDPVTRSVQLKQLGVHGLELHCGLDQQAFGLCSLDNAAAVIRQAQLPVSIAGGVNAASIEQVRKLGASVAVVGAAIYGAPDPASVAKSLREKIG